jgi:hypothetical protein
MLILPMVLGLLALDPGEDAPRTRGHCPSGSLAERLDPGSLALLWDADARVQVFRSPAREEEGRSVLAEVEGPGFVRAIELGPDRGGGPARLRIVLDGRDSAAIDLSLDDLFGGRHPRFPGPLVGSGPEGRSCFVPISFREGCRVVADGPVGGPYRIEVVRLPRPEDAAPFSEELSPADRLAVDRIRSLGEHPERFDARSLPGAEDAEYPVEALGRASLTFALPPGARTVRWMEIRASDPEPWLSARLRIAFDADLEEATVDLPLGLFFGPSRGEAGLPSGLAGRAGSLLYSRLPMPYRRGGRLHLGAATPLSGTIRLVTVPGVAPLAGRLHAGLLGGRGRGGLEGGASLSSRGRGHILGVLAAGAVGLTIDGRAFPLGLADGAAVRWSPAGAVPFREQFRASVIGDAAIPDNAAVFWYGEPVGPTPGGR